MKKISILGIGISGVAAALLTKKNNWVPFLSDMASKEKLATFLSQLDAAGIEYETNGHSERIFDCETLILSPGISRKNIFVNRCLEKGIPVISEIEFAYRVSNYQCIAITGSNGKTSTTTLLGKMLNSLYSGTRIAGNIGNAFSELVLNENLNGPLALELSSFQLESMSHFKPTISIWLNLSPNHLDWYDTMDDYANAKAQLYQNNDEHSIMIVNKDDSIVMEHSQKAKGQRICFSLKDSVADAHLEHDTLVIRNKKLLRRDELQLQGPHHVMNMMAASLAADIMGIPLDKIRDVLRNFNGLEHRMESVCDINGYRFINDSKSTSIEALRMALQSFSKPIILLCGGKHKGASYQSLYDLIRSNCKEVYVFGQAAEIMEKDWTGHPQLHRVDTVFQAIDTIISTSGNNDIVLFSPACSSFDQFLNYEDRGNKFKAYLSAIEVKQ